jgi:hypothetical protein
MPTAGVAACPVAGGPVGELGGGDEGAVEPVSVGDPLEVAELLLVADAEEDVLVVGDDFAVEDCRALVVGLTERDA